MMKKINSLLRAYIYINFYEDWHVGSQRRFAILLKKNSDWDFYKISIFIREFCHFWAYVDLFGLYWHIYFLLYGTDKGNLETTGLKLHAHASPC